MNQVPLFRLCAVSPAVSAVFGSSPTRVYPFGKAPASVATPYATWQLITGAPESYLAERPDIDSATIQIDVYADTDADVRAAVVALRDLIETRANIVRWGDEDVDPDTQLFHRSFDVDWWVPR